jgi:ribonuclease-3
MTEETTKLEQKINIKFKDQELLKKALIHKSYDHSNNNEKLEFLGDRVLGLILAKTLIKIYPEEKEGVIDKKFANLVNKKTCLLIAKKIELKKYITTGNSYKGLSRSDDKIIGDGLEALLGAIYLDQGIKSVEKFILKLWDKDLKASSVTYVDSKTKLQEYSLKKYKTLPIYKLIENIGPRHKPIFKVGVRLENSKFINGTGNSKKDAEQKAAALFLKNIKI